MSEVHPLTIIEAVAAGLLVAAVNSPGIVDIVHPGECGCLAHSSPGSLAAAIIALARDPGRRCRMGLAARATSRRYDITHTIESTLALYYKVQDSASKP